MTDFRNSFDARDWAAAFMALATEKPEVATDEGAMIAWFANALMRGYDERTTGRCVSCQALADGFRRPDVLAEVARCERCKKVFVSPTTGRHNGDCMYCGGRIVATKGEWQPLGEPALSEWTAVVLDSGVTYARHRCGRTFIVEQAHECAT